MTFLIDDIEINKEDYFRIISKSPETVDMILRECLTGLKVDILRDNNFVFNPYRLVFVYKNKQELLLDVVRDLDTRQLVEAIRVIKFNPERNVINGSDV